MPVPNQIDRQRSDAFGQRRARRSAIVVLGLATTCGGLAGCMSRLFSAVSPVVPYAAYYHNAFESSSAIPIETVSADSIAGWGTLASDAINGEKAARPITLLQAIEVAVSSTTVLKSNAQFLTENSSLFANAEGVESALDPTIQQTGVTLGNRGAEGAQSDFDWTLNGNLIWSRDELAQNNSFTGGFVPGSTFVNEQADFDLSLSKNLLTGGVLQFGQTVDYSGSNIINQLFPSSYTGDLNFSVTQPLLAGAGQRFTEIAGPVSLISPGDVTPNQGIVIARINGEVAQQEFAEDVDNLIKNVVDAYWDLSLAEETLAVEEEAVERLEEIWIRKKTDLETGRANTSEEAEAASSYHNAAARVGEQKSNRQFAETRLRRLLSMPPQDGFELQPIDAPTRDYYVRDFQTVLAEALARRGELRRTKWLIKSLQLQLAAAHSLAQPRLDLQAGYQVNAFGDRLLSSQRDDGSSIARTFRSYGNSLFQGDQTGWNVGLVFSMPLRFREELTQIRNLETRLTKVRAVLAAQEAEIAHEIEFAVSRVKSFEEILEAYRQSRSASQRRLDAVEADYEATRATLTQLLEAQNAFVRAETDVKQAEFDFIKAKAELYYREGTLAERQQILIRYDTDQVDEPSEPGPLPTYDDMVSLPVTPVRILAADSAWGDDLQLVAPPLGTIAFDPSGQGVVEGDALTIDDGTEVREIDLRPIVE